MNFLSNAFQIDDFDDEVEEKANDEIEANDTRKISIYYLSDLHLDYKVSNDDVDSYIDDKIIRVLKNAYIKLGINCVLIVAGDVSYTKEYVLKLFKKIRDKFEYLTIFYVLGNHEYWPYSGKSVDEVVQDYKDSLSKYNVYCLNNEIGFICDWLGKCGSIPYNELIDLTDKELQKKILDNSFYNFIIYGTTGFSGLDSSYNANNNVYNGVISRDNEIELSEQSSMIYKRISSVFKGFKAICVSHMPLCEWTNEPYVEGWKYVSGHTHKNTIDINDKYELYADNQIGYESNNYGFKYFYVELFDNPLIKYADGIHNISVKQYYDYCLYNRLRCSTNLFNGTIIYLKKKRYNLFLFKKEDGKLMILYGGRKRNIYFQDVQFYYDNMDKYAEALKKGLSEYHDYLHHLSAEIESIGGTGKIHGCIVDIDYYNHIYVNPFDGSINSYYAYSKVQKYFFKNFYSLLYFCNNKLYVSLNEKIKEEKFQLIENNNELSKDYKYVEDTSMYRYSDMIKALQSVILNGTIWVWNNKVLGIDEPVKEKKPPVPRLTAEQKLEIKRANTDYNKIVNKLTKGKIAVDDKKNDSKTIHCMCLRCFSEFKLTYEDVDKGEIKCPNCD